VLGLNRDLHGKPTGVRTLGLVCLGSALAVLSIHAVTGTDASRVIQGIVESPAREAPAGLDARDGTWSARPQWSRPSGRERFMGLGYT